MGQEYFINSHELQNKVANLLPSQGGAGAGFDLSASNQIVPIIDLTESAQGSDVRADLQSAFSLQNATTFNVQNKTTTVVTTTGYWRILAISSQLAISTAIRSNFVQLTDGTTTKNVWLHSVVDADNTQISSIQCDFIVYLRAGESLVMGSTSVRSNFIGSVRQIADIDGNLVNP